MNKARLIERIAKDAAITKTRAAIAVESLVQGISEALEQEERVTISGLGTWTVSRRRARAGRNPQTGEAIRIEAKRTARFRPGKNLETRLNE